jgi:transcriptional regulator with XRE-family HTH domain
MLTTSTDETQPADIADVGLLDVDKIKRRRVELGLNQQQAAARAELAGGKVRWGDIESGRRANVTLATLEKIAGALECEPAELLVKPRR